MLEYVLYRRHKRKKEDGKSDENNGRGKDKDTHLLDEPEPVLTTEDEAFLATIVDDVEHRPPLPPRLTPQLSLYISDDEPMPAEAPMAENGTAARRTQPVRVAESDAPAEDDAKTRHGRLSFLFREGKPDALTALTRRLPDAKMQLQRILPGRSQSQPTSPQQLQPEYEEADDDDDENQPSGTSRQDMKTDAKTKNNKKKEAELAELLEDLNMGTKGNRAFSLSVESAELAHKFNQVLRDLVEGVPTAYSDLTHLLDDKEGTLNRAFEKLPSPMRRLVEQLPEKVTGALGPEMLAAAAEAGGIKVALDHAAAKSGTKGAAKKAVKSGVMSMLTPSTLHKLVTKPGAVAGMLRAIVTTLKTRWPAFISTNIVFSVAVFCE